MSLDFEAIRQQREKSLADLLSQQQSSIGTNLNRYQNLIEGGRNAFFSQNVDPLVSGAYSQATQAAKAYQGDRLGRELASQLSGTRYGQLGVNLGLRQSNLSRQLDEARQTQLSSEDFTRKARTLSEQQRFESQQSELDRDLRQQQSDLSDVAAQRGLDIEQQFAPQSDYESALARALGTLTGALGTYGAYRRFGRTNTSYPFEQSKFYNPNSNFSQNLTFTPRTFDFQRSGLLPLSYGR